MKKSVNKTVVVNREELVGFCDKCGKKLEMFFTKEKKQEIRNRDKGIVTTILPDNEIPCARDDIQAEVLLSPLSKVVREAGAGDKDAIKVFDNYNKLTRCEYT